MTIMADNRMMAQMSMTDGFIAALDQSGGSPQPNTGDKHASRGRWGWSRRVLLWWSAREGRT
jgi:hypothetical protein